MDRLASTFDAKTAATLALHEERSMIAKIISISLDRRNHPDLYDELLLDYFTITPEILERSKLKKFGPRAAQVSVKHTTPEYRLAWEYCLLTCYREKMPEFADWRPGEALRTMADNRSIITLAYFYREQLSTGAIKPQQFQITRIERTIASMPSVIGLNAFLECFTLSEQYELINKDYFDDTTSVRFLALFQEHSVERLNLWKTVIRDYSKDNLTPSQRQLLQSIIDMQPKDK